MRVVLMVVIFMMLVSPTWAFNWLVAEVGGDDSEQGPYQGGEVKFLPDGGFTISATGGDIWGNKIGCTLAYIEGGISGDFIIEYTIEEHTTDPPTTWSKCGVMIAQEIDPETPYVFLQSTCSNDPTALNDKGSKIITREAWGGGAGPGSNGWAPLQWPVTYKMVREGDIFTASLSFDGGKTYESVEDAADGKAGFTELAFKDPVVLGIAINGHNAGQTTGTATVVDIRLNGEDTFAVEASGKLATMWAELKG